MFGRVFAWTLLEEGSTRALGLMRLGLAALAWCRWANDFLPFRDLHADRVAIGTALLVGSTGMFFGFWSRASTALTGVALLFVYFWVGHHQGVESYTHHHTWLLTIAICILALAPCGRSYSLDRYLAVRRAERSRLPAPPEHGSLWATRLLGAQMSVVYFWGAYEKCNPAFLDGTRMIHHYMSLYVGSDYPGSWMEPITRAAAVGTVILEFSLAFLLWFPRLQRWLIPLAMTFHALIYYTLPVGTFTLTMWLLFLAFVPPGRVHAFTETVHGTRSDPLTSI